MLSFFPRDVLNEIWDLIESVSKGFPTYSLDILFFTQRKSILLLSSRYHIMSHALILNNCVKI